MPARQELARLFSTGAWLYLSMMANYAGGFLFWVIASLALPASIMGMVSATVGLGVLLAGIVSLGVGTGLQGLVGRETGKGNRMRAAGYATAGIVVVLLASLSAWTLAISFLLYARVEGGVIILGLVLMTVAALSQVCWGYLVGILETRTIFVYTAAGQALRSLAVVSAWTAGVLTWWLASLSYMAQPLALIVAGALIGCVSYRYSDRLLSLIRELVRYSLPSWIPNTILLAGQWIGVLAIYTSAGKVDTGVYYIAFVIFNAIAGPGIAVASMLLPILSSKEGDGGLVGDSLRLSLSLVTPIAVAAAIVPDYITSILGPDYSGASSILPLLLASLPAVIVFQAVYSYVYAMGGLRSVLILGLAQNLPRLILYLALVPSMAGVGAAYAFTLGAYTGLLASLAYTPLAPKRLAWIIASTTIIPLTMAGVLLYMGLPRLFTALILIVASYTLYVVLGIVKKGEVAGASRIVIEVLSLH